MNDNDNSALKELNNGLKYEINYLSIISFVVLLLAIGGIVLSAYLTREYRQHRAIAGIIGIAGGALVIVSVIMAIVARVRGKFKRYNFFCYLVILLAVLAVITAAYKWVERHLDQQLAEQEHLLEGTGRRP